LTYEVSSNPRTLVLVASGGAAGSGDSVVSESQAYALFVTGAVLASWDTHAANRNDIDRQEVIDAFEGYFNGWMKMCQNSNGGASCQDEQLCNDGMGTVSVCLPHWQQKADLTEVRGTGAAPDGDEDAITGMILALAAVSSDDTRPGWFERAQSWTDASITAFMRYNTDSSNDDYNLVKLGSCWGGWGSSGQNPSYHSPGSYRLMRDFYKAYPNQIRPYASVSDDDFEKLIDTSYQVLFGVQCAEQGMVPNWARVVVKDGTVTSDGGQFSGSGTPQHEFGAEAARTIWRVAFDAALQGGNPGNDSTSFLDPLLRRLSFGYREAVNSYPQYWEETTFEACRADNTNNDITIFSGGWLYNMFIYGPVVSSLIVPFQDSTKEEQQAMIDAAAEVLGKNLPSGYYSRSWALLANLAVGGAIESAAKTFYGRNKGSFPTSAPNSSNHNTPTKSPTETSGDGCCSHDFKTW